mgnify:CR=1 FL=1|jgi:hypothetical protein|tara:strand:+ start:2094 stop:2420 length:327 start_codon:yes stop_codon:yes gene_type:complete
MSKDNLQSLAVDVTFFFVQRLLREKPQAVLKQEAIWAIAHLVNEVCGLEDYKIEVKEICINGLIRQGKYDEDHEKAEALANTLFSDNASEDDLKEISDWANLVAETWK